MDQTARTDMPASLHHNGSDRSICRYVGLPDLVDDWTKIGDINKTQDSSFQLPAYGDR